MRYHSHYNHASDFNLPPCRVCGALRGCPCTEDGKARTPHDTREADWEKERSTLLRIAEPNV